MARKLLVCAMVCLILMLPATSFGQEQTPPDGLELITAMLRRLGNDSTTFSRKGLTLQEGSTVERFEAEVWSLPDWVRRVELTQPAIVRGTAAVVKAAKTHMLTQNDRGRREYNLASIVALFALSDDILSPGLFDEALWSDAVVTVGTDVAGRASFELQAQNSWGERLSLFIDQKSFVPLSIFIDDGRERIELLSIVEHAEDETGDITHLRLHMSDVEFNAEVQLERLNSIMVARRVTAHVPGLTVDLQVHSVVEATIPEELAVSADMVPQEDARFLRAGQLTIEGDYIAAMRELESLTRSDPYHVAGHIQLGYVYLQLGDWMGARASFEQALLLEPTNLVAANNLAYVYIESGTGIDRGVALAQAVVELRPTNSSYLDTLGWGLYKLERYGEAVIVLAMAVEYAQQQLRPLESVEVLYHYARALQAIGQHDAARVVALEGLELDPQDFHLIELMAELGTK